MEKIQELADKVVTTFNQTEKYMSLFSDQVDGKLFSITSKLHLEEDMEFMFEFKALDAKAEILSMVTEQLYMESFNRTLRFIKGFKENTKLTVQEFSERVRNCGDKQVVVSAEANAAMQDLGNFEAKIDDKMLFMGCHQMGTWFGKRLWVNPYLTHATVFILPINFASVSVESETDHDQIGFTIKPVINMEECEVFHITDIYNLKNRINFTN